jgi:hypothetical protein
MQRMALPILALSVVCGRPVVAQTDTSHIVVSGVVVDPLKRPVEGVEVLVVKNGTTVMTNPEGAFRLSLPRVREILLLVRRPGFNALSLKLDRDWSGIIQITPGAFRLPELEVTSKGSKPVKYSGTSKYDDIFRRQHAGVGELISREDIARRAPMNTPEILEGRAGIRITSQRPGLPTFIAFSRCNEYPPRINVYVDGHKLLPPRTDLTTGSPSPLMMGAQVSRDPLVRGMVGEMLNRISPNDIELVEIFRGPGELPPEFNDGNCGAIAVWTREGGQ